MLYIMANPVRAEMACAQAGPERDTAMEGEAQTEEPTAPTPPTALSAMCDLFRETYRESVAPAASLPTLFEEDMKRYQNETPLRADQDPLLWWKTMH